MDEKTINALISALTQQRNQAMTALAQTTANFTVAQERISTLEKKVLELTAKTSEKDA